MWVDYQGKHATAFESAAVAIATQQVDGSYHFHWPQLIDWQASWAIERAYFWDTMPAERRWLRPGWSCGRGCRGGSCSAAAGY